MSYQETAYAVMKKFLTDFTEEELKNCIDRAYDSKFDTPQIAPLVNADGAYYLELSMVLRSHLKIWLFLFCHIYLQQPQRRIM